MQDKYLNTGNRNVTNEYGKIIHIEMPKDFYADHLMDEVDENYLTNIVEYLNK